ncbi:glycosyltransferase family 2 protein [Zobellella iuensis]|uniref:Glycosyltransferase family 2 protein n=1 Tax=Zobellella iuensis TaxID=2803811 RepID=A0ABS1QUH3_9GAMM|nr:glycosyltransferase family A protein [Zobellella iuensis]MBL1377763.1 glycosyltransferase family 2 protein [Zobellella iuensis]
MNHAVTFPSDFAKGNALLRRGKLSGAIDAFLKAIDSNPGFVHYYLNLSWALLPGDIQAKDVNDVLRSVTAHGKPLVSSNTYKLVQQSQMVNGKWYVTEYRHWLPEGVDPILHYLILGWRLGLNPCKRFDTQFYLRAHASELAERENPLLHYLRVGQKKGNPIKSQSLKTHVAVNLWGGHSVSALKELSTIYTDESVDKAQRWWALWHTARWRYFCGEFEEAERLSKEMDLMGSIYQKLKESVYLRYFCQLLQGRHQDARSTMEAYLQRAPKDADALLAYSNSLQSDDKRLAVINQAYALHDLAGMQRLDTSKPLAIDNIKSQPVKACQENIKVSIIMPIYQAEDQVEIAIRSLLSQSYRNIEIIAVDDCSPDGTFSVLKRLAKQDARIKAVQPPQNGGAYAARNYGLGFATGDLVTTHDSDDWSHPQKIEIQVRYLQAHPKVKGCAVHWIRAQQDLRFTQNWRPNNVLTHWSQSSFMFRREILDAIGNWDHVRIGGDTEYIWRMQAHYGKASFAKILPEIPLAFALDEESSLTRTKATHVRTVYYGLRHIYRESCAWWHSTGKNLHVSDASQKRTFPAPRSMFERSDQPLHYNILIAGDFSRLEDCKKIAKKVRQQGNQNQRVCLFHWPDFNKKPEPLCNLYFELLKQNRVEPVVMGQVVTCKEYLITDMALLQYPLDGYPEMQEFDNWKAL